MTNPTAAPSPQQAVAEPLPCPFCDGASAVTCGYTVSELPWSMDGGAFFRVYCSRCQSRQLFHETASEAIEAWKRRAPQAVSDPPAGVAVGWQPIATAPRDGTHILVCQAGRPYDDLWTFNQNPPHVVHWFEFGSPGFYLSHTIGEQTKPYEYTHWKPLGAEPCDTKRLEAEAARYPTTVATLICAKCGVDRYKAACPQNWDCGMVSQAQNALATPTHQAAEPPVHEDSVLLDAERYRWLRDEAIWRGEPDGKGDMVWCVIGPDAFNLTPIDGKDLDEVVDRRLAARAPAADGAEATKPCAGANCGKTNGQHSLECIAEHARACAPTAKE